MLTPVTIGGIRVIVHGDDAEGKEGKEKTCKLCIQDFCSSTNHILIFRLKCHLEDE